MAQFVLDGESPLDAACLAAGPDGVVWATETKVVGVEMKRPADLDWDDQEARTR